MRRRPWGSKRELWDCAIPGAEAAEVVVRATCEPEGVIHVTARTPLSAHEVEQIGLEEGQIRKRPAEQ